MTPLDARRLTERISLRLVTVAENLEAVGPLIEQAAAGSAHQALGYKSWTAYVAGEFGDQLTRLAGLDRGSVVDLLTDQQMSARAIAATIGVSASTVDRQVRHNDAPSPATPGSAQDAVSDTLGVEKSPAANNVVGIDGKTYTRPTPAPPAKSRRQPLPDAWRDASFRLVKAAETLGRLRGDDRFRANREALMVADIAITANICMRLLDDLEVDRHRYHDGTNCWPGGAR